MTAEMDVPGIGNVQQKWVYAGGAIVLGIGGYAWWKRRGAASSAPTVALNPNDVVPATSFTPAPTGNATQNVDSTAGSPPATNAQWTQQAVTMLANYGFDPIVASAALGKFLTRTGLSASEQEVVQRAVGLLGYPPQGGPWSILPAPAGSSGSGGAMTAPGNLHVNMSSGGAQIVWDADTATDSYRVEVRSQPTQHLYQEQVPGPHAVRTTGVFFPTQDHGVVRVVTVIPTNATGDGPSASTSFTS